VDEFMKAYTIKEVSKLLDTPEGTLRQWEKDFPDVLVIPRDAQNARYYTEFEIDTLKHIKSMREKNLSKKMIKELLQKHSEINSERNHVVEPTVPTLKQSEAIETLRNIQNALETLPEIKELIVSELKSEIRSEIKNELNNAVRNEIASSLEAGNKNTSEQIKTLSEALDNMEANYKNEIQRRDKILMENLRLIKEINDREKNKGFFKKLF
jgi:DNA-binding transcriptional MerR regulator